MSRHWATVKQFYILLKKDEKFLVLFAHFLAYKGKQHSADLLYRKSAVWGDFISLNKIT